MLAAATKPENRLWLPTSSPHPDRELLMCVANNGITLMIRCLPVCASRAADGGAPMCQSATTMRPLCARQPSHTTGPNPTDTREPQTLFFQLVFIHQPTSIQSILINRADNICIIFLKHTPFGGEREDGSHWTDNKRPAECSPLRSRWPGFGPDSLQGNHRRGARPQEEAHRL